MNESQFDQITLRSRESQENSPVTKMPRRRDVSLLSDLSSFRTEDQFSMRSSQPDPNDRELDLALRRIARLSEEILIHDDLDRYVRSLTDRIDLARKTAALTISELNERMDFIEQAWDDQIVQEQQAISREVASLLAELRDEDDNSSSSEGGSAEDAAAAAVAADAAADSSRSSSKRKKQKQQRPKTKITSQERSSGSDEDVTSGASSFTAKVARVKRKERQVKGRAADVRQDSRHLSALGHSLDSISELERDVCGRLQRLQTAAAGAAAAAAGSGGRCCDAVELADNYRLSVKHISNAIRALSAVSTVAGDAPFTKKEIDNVCCSMKSFLGRVKEQLSDETTGEELQQQQQQPQSSVRVARRSSKRSSGRNSAESAATASSAYQSTKDARGSSSDFSSFAASTAHSIESQKK